MSAHDGRGPRRRSAARCGRQDAVRRAGRRRQLRSDRGGRQGRVAFRADVNRDRRRDRRDRAGGGNRRDGRLPDHARARRSVGRQRCGVRLPRARADRGLHRQPALPVRSSANRSCGTDGADHEVVRQLETRQCAAGSRCPPSTRQRHGRPGPVHVDCPGDVVASTHDDDRRRRLVSNSRSDRFPRRRIGRGSRHFWPPRANRCCSSDLALAVRRMPPPFDPSAPRETSPRW